MTAKAQTVTILFTDLVGSTELLQRAGDEQAQRIFKAHHRLLREAVAAHGGNEVKWLGDGLMVAFDSAADAIKCAIAMQQSSRRPTAGERLEIRAGLHVGEAFVDESDYFGTSVVIARRLCDKASAGQIFASDIVVRLLDGRGADIKANDLGAIELKGITNKIPAVEIVYQHDPMALLRKLPFVGRQAEYETMLKRLAEARNGRGSVILLAGEPGIGKTRLTEEFCDHASSGATVVRGNCYEGDVAAPFAPWVEALRSLVDQTADADLRGTLGPGAPDVAAMIPEIRSRLPDLEESPKLDPESQRARLFESIAVFLRNAAEKRPLVIFLDDLHWCDRPSLALLEQIARGIADRRIVIVGTYRDVEVDRVHPLAQTLAALRRLEHHERLAIRGFTQESVYELLDAIEPSDEAEASKRALAALLHAEADGNPLFIREVLNNLIETGKLAQQDGVWTGTVASIEELGIPEGIREVIGRRLSRLSESCNKMLQRASAMANGVTWDELVAICEESEDALLDALDEALGAQLIAERSRNIYTFTHALIRATLYDELSTPRRVLLHRRTAEALEALYADDLEAHLGELAAHYLASSGGDAQRAIEYSIRAGDHAQRLFAWEEAATHYERSLEAMDMAGAAPDARRCQAMLSLATCDMYTGAAPNVGRLREIADIARRGRLSELFAQAAILFEHTVYDLDEDLSRERLAMLDEALAMLEGQDTVQRVHVLCRRVVAAAAVASSHAGNAPTGFAAYAGPKDPNVLAQAREALALAERLGDDDAIAMACEVLHSYCWTPENLAERSELVDRGFAAAERAGSVLLKGWFFELRACVLVENGDIPAFRRNTAEFHSFVEIVRFSAYGYFPRAMLVAIESAEGQLGLAEQHWNEYNAKLPAGSANAIANSVTQLALIRYLQGRAVELKPMWGAIVAQFPAIPAYAAYFALIYALNDETVDAETIVDNLTADNLSSIPRDFLWKPTMWMLGEACADVQRRDSAVVLYDALIPFATANAAIIHTVPLGSMARVVARLATVLERYDEAEQHFEEALAANDRMGFHAWTAWTRLNYGEMLLRRDRPGDRDRAVALLTEALAFARESGMQKVQRDTEQLLAPIA